ELLQGVFSGQVTDIRGALKKLSDDSARDREQALQKAVAEGAEVEEDHWAFPDWQPATDYTVQRWPARTPSVPATPKVMSIMADQQRAGFTAGTGFGLETMPFCDELAASGTSFRGTYTPKPACVPARTSLLSGRYPSAHRVRQNSNNRKEFRGADLFNVYAGAGYQTWF